MMQFEHTTNGFAQNVYLTVNAVDGIVKIVESQSGYFLIYDPNGMLLDFTRYDTLEKAQRRVESVFTSLTDQNFQAVRTYKMVKHQPVKIAA